MEDFSFYFIFFYFKVIFKSFLKHSLNHFVFWSKPHITKIQMH